MSAAETFRTLALALPEAEEKAHFQRASFRVRNRIFATLAEDNEEGVVKLPLADQTALVDTAPDVFFLPGWSHQGWTGLRLAQIDDAQLATLIKTAWRNVAPKSIDDPG